MSNRKAIVTLAVGNEFTRIWRENCQENWQKYADKFGYDVICLESPLDDSERARNRSAAWQKCLILGHESIKKYERVVWIDADILINSEKSPCIVAQVPTKKIGAVNAWAIPTAELAQTVLDRLYDFWGADCTICDRTPQEYYASYGINADYSQVVQTGVLVLSPLHHRALLEYVYYNYEEIGKGNYEMRPLSYEILKSGDVHWLDHRFNLVWLVYKVLYYPFLLEKSRKENRILPRIKRKISTVFQPSPNTELEKMCVAATLENSFFLHFAGTFKDIELVRES